MFGNIEKLREKLRVEKFCCCTDLQKGCFIIGGLEWIFIFLRIYIIASRTTVAENSTISYYDIEYKICYIVISIIISVALIWGAHKYRKHFLIPWLVIKCFESMLLVIVTIVFFSIIFFTPDYLFLAIITFIAFFIGTIVSWYFWICVWNFYHSCCDFNTNTVAPVSYIEGINKESHMA